MKTMILMTFSLFSFMCLGATTFRCQTTDEKIILETVLREGRPQERLLAKFTRPKKYDTYFNVHPLTLNNNAFFVTDVDYGTKRDRFRLSLG